MSDARYAIFFVPPADGALYRFGASALGYDSYSGRDVPSLPGDGGSAAEWRQLTAEPRRYGFHATLKAPFHLRNECSENDLIAEFAEQAGGLLSPARFAGSIQTLDGFAALVPAAPAPALNLLADTCVRAFDRFRAPLSEGERNRRLAQNLAPRQISYLERWGYPLVFEDFRFHMTLTGRIPPGQTAAVLRFLHEALKRHPVPAIVEIETVALLRQDRPDSRFRVIHEAVLRNAAGPAGASRRQDATVFG
jgi:hypothetical protein